MMKDAPELLPIFLAVSEAYESLVYMWLPSFCLQANKNTETEV